MRSEGSGYPFTVTLAKTGDVRFLSHLDLMRLLERGLRRSGLPLRHTQGFNPHVRMSLSDALPVGVESLDERLLIHLEDDLPAQAVQERLAQVFPLGVEVLAVAAGHGRPRAAAEFWQLAPPSSALRAAVDASLRELDQTGSPWQRFVASMSETDSGLTVQLVECEGRRLKIRDLVAKVRAHDPSLALVRARKLPQGECT